MRLFAACFVWAVVLILFLYFFAALSTVLLGVLGAAIVAVTLHPLARFIPGRPGVAAAVLGLALIATVGSLLLALSWPLAKPIRHELEQWPKTRQSVNDFLARMTAKVGISDQPTAEELVAAQKTEAARQDLPSQAQLTQKQLKDVEDRLRAEKRLTVEKILGNIGNFLAGEGGQQLFSRSADMSLGILLWLVFIFVGSIFLLADSNQTLLGPILLLAPRRQRDNLRQMLEELGPRLRRWVVGTLLSMAIVFCASLCGYLVIGLEFAVPLALLAGLCEIVPTVGPATSAVTACIFAAATGTGATVVGVLCVWAIIQSIEAWIILPLIMRGAVKIQPAVMLFSIVLWGKLFGVPGLMLAIPIDLTLWTIAQHFIIRRRLSPQAG
jgi:predicted PurR-regulated permease PerM